MKKSDEKRTVPTELRALCNEIRTKLAHAEKAESEAYYEAGKKILQEMKKRKLPQEQLKLIAEDVGRKYKLLYRDAKLAEAWGTKSEFAAVCERKNAKGLPITVSHLHFIAEYSLREGKDPSELIDIVLENSLSVRELRKKYVKAKPRGKLTAEQVTKSVVAEQPRVERWRDAVTAGKAKPDAEAWRNTASALRSFQEAITKLIGDIDDLLKAARSAAPAESPDTSGGEPDTDTASWNPMNGGGSVHIS